MGSHVYLCIFFLLFYEYNCTLFHIGSSSLGLPVSSYWGKRKSSFSGFVRMVSRATLTRRWTRLLYGLASTLSSPSYSQDSNNLSIWNHNITWVTSLQSCTDISLTLSGLPLLSFPERIGWQHASATHRLMHYWNTLLSYLEFWPGN